MGTGDKLLGCNLRWNSIPSRSRLHATENEISSGSVGKFGPSAALPIILSNAVQIQNKGYLSSSHVAVETLAVEMNQRLVGARM